MSTERKSDAHLLGCLSGNRCQACANEITADALLNSPAAPWADDPDKHVDSTYQSHDKGTSLVPARPFLSPKSTAFGVDWATDVSRAGAVLLRRSLAIVGEVRKPKAEADADADAITALWFLLHDYPRGAKRIVAQIPVLELQDIQRATEQLLDMIEHQLTVGAVD